MLGVHLKEFGRRTRSDNVDKNNKMKSSRATRNMGSVRVDEFQNKRGHFQFENVLALFLRTFSLLTSFSFQVFVSSLFCLLSNIHHLGKLCWVSFSSCFFVFCLFLGFFGVIWVVALWDSEIIIFHFSTSRREMILNRE